MSIEFDEAERRYDEAGNESHTVLTSEMLQHPVSMLSPQAAVVVGREQSVAEASRALREGPHGCVVIVEEQGHGRPAGILTGMLTGILTETDIVERVVAAGLDAGETRVREVMTSGPASLGTDDSIGFALHKMAVGNYRHLPVVDAEGRPIGVVRQREVLRYLASFFPAEVINLPPRSIEDSPPRNQHGG